MDKILSQDSFARKEEREFFNDLFPSNIFECLVIDNSTFWQNGKIRIRRCLAKNAGEEFSDLSENPQYSNEEGFIKIEETESNEQPSFDSDSWQRSDEWAEVSNTFGGAYDFGTFHLPQPNTHGLVARISCSSINKPRWVWLGSLISTDPSLNLMETPGEASGVLRTINAPSDDIDSHNAFNDANSNFSNDNTRNNTIVLKQKETHWEKDKNGKFDYEKCKDTLNWETRNTLNMAVLDKDKASLEHPIYNDDEEQEGTAKILVSSKDEKIELKIAFSGDENSSAVITLNKSGAINIVSNINDNTVSNNISLSEDGTDIYVNKSDDNWSSAINIGGSDDQVNISQSSSSGKASLSMQGNNINITASDGSKPIINLNVGNGDVLINGGSTGHSVIGLETSLPTGSTIANSDATAFTVTNIKF